MNRYLLENTIEWRNSYDYAARTEWDTSIVFWVCSIKYASKVRKTGLALSTKTDNVRSFFIHFIAMTIVSSAFFTSWNEQKGPEITSKITGQSPILSNHPQSKFIYSSIFSKSFHLISPINFIINSNLYLSIWRERKRIEKKKEEIWSVMVCYPIPWEHQRRSMKWEDGLRM